MDGILRCVGLRTSTNFNCHKKKKKVLILMFKELVANLVGLNFNIRKLGQHSGEEKTLTWFPLMTAIMKL